MRLSLHGFDAETPQVTRHQVAAGHPPIKASALYLPLPWRDPARDPGGDVAGRVDQDTRRERRAESGASQERGAGGHEGRLE